MGGNQAMCDAADILPQVIDLNSKALEGKLDEIDYSTAVLNYEKEMLPRAFRWVRESGGDSQRVRPTLPHPELISEL
jgi:hypothetical protein